MEETYRDVLLRIYNKSLSQHMSGLHEVSVLNIFTIGPYRLQSHGAEAERRPSPEAVSDQILPLPWP